jgi:hypothetical protein
VFLFQNHLSATPHCHACSRNLNQDAWTDLLIYCAIPLLKPSFRGPLMPNLPFILEDRTGLVTGSDFDDIYDRIFLRVANATGSHQRGPPSTVMVYKMSQRASRRRDSLPFHYNPAVILEFGHNGSLGLISFPEQNGYTGISMNRYLRRTSLFGG